MNKLTGRGVAISQKRLVIAFAVFMILLFFLCIRIGYVQIVKGNEYSKIAVEQQKKDEILKPDRGKIYDRNGEELAVSIESYSIWVRPREIMNGKNNKENEEKVETVSKELAEITKMDKDTIKKNITETKKTLLKVAKYMDRDAADKIREKKLVGVSLSDEVRRYYPMGDFLSHTLGSVTDDNDGLSGLELQYNKYLAGVDGRWLKSTDVSGNSLVDGTERYYEPEDGKNLSLTIDQIIQNFTEKSVKDIYEKYDANRVSCIVMETKTGEVLSLASAPSFDPNNSKIPTDSDEREEFKKLDPKEQMDYLNEMWRNPIVSNVYEPGSTAKLITAAAALEEGITHKDEKFNCEGFYTVNGVDVKCWRYDRPHGIQNLYEGVGNSCNPVFMQLALRLGKEKFYNYLELFGMTEKTNIDFPGEASQILANEKMATQLDLAIMGFGQTNAVTPMQLITAVSAIGNSGKVMEPHLVKEITDTDGKVIKTIKPRVVRKAISEETADEICTIMEFVVNEATGSRAKVPGYKIGGKTGTSQVASKDGGYTKDVIASFVGMAPMEDPQFTILYIIDSPAGGDQGGEIAAPAARDLLEKILKYKDIKPNYTDEEKLTLEKDNIMVPNVKGKTISEAKKILEAKGLKYRISPELKEEKEFIVKGQYPAGGQKANKNSIIYLYRE